MQVVHKVNAPESAVAIPILDTRGDISSSPGSDRLSKICRVGLGFERSRYRKAMSAILLVTGYKAKRLTSSDVSIAVFVLLLCPRFDGLRHLNQSDLMDDSISLPVIVLVCSHKGKACEYLESLICLGTPSMAAV